MSPGSPWSRGLFAMLLLVVTFLTLTPNPEETEGGFALARWVAAIVLGEPGLTDKVAHFMAYGALGAAAFWAQLRLFKTRWALPAMLAAYGAALEGLQGLGGVRSPELADAVANFLGVVAAYGGASLIAFFLTRRAA